MTFTLYDLLILSTILIYKLVKRHQKDVDEICDIVSERIEDITNRAKMGGGDPNQFSDDYWEKRTGVHEVRRGGVVRGNFSTILRPGLKVLFKDCTYYPGKVFFLEDGESFNPIIEEEEPTKYDDEYWRIWRNKHKHEEDPG